MDMFDLRLNLLGKLSKSLGQDNLYMKKDTKCMKVFQNPNSIKRHNLSIKDFQALSHKLYSEKLYQNRSCSHLLIYHKSIL